MSAFPSSHSRNNPGFNSGKLTRVEFDKLLRNLRYTRKRLSSHLWPMIQTHFVKKEYSSLYSVDDKIVIWIDFI